MLRQKVNVAKFHSYFAIHLIRYIYIYIYMLRHAFDKNLSLYV
jgi:hypothetical protein